MKVVDVVGAAAKHTAMADTWGHLYPVPGSKIPCKILVIAHGGFCKVLDRVHNTSFSPVEFELVGTILDMYEWPDYLLSEHGGLGEVKLNGEWQSASLAFGRVLVGDSL